MVWAMPNGKNATNVLHGRDLGSVGVDTAFADSVNATITGDPRTTAWLARVSDAAGLLKCTARTLDIGLAPEFESTASISSGTDATPPLPEGVALCVTLKSAIAGRSGRGRVYLPGIAVDQVDAAGHCVAGATADATAFMTAVSDAFFTNGMFLTVAHRAHDAYVSPATGFTVPASPASDAIVSQVIVNDNVFDSQRRRK